MYSSRRMLYPINIFIIFLLTTFPHINFAQNNVKIEIKNTPDRVKIKKIENNLKKLTLILNNAYANDRKFSEKHASPLCSQECLDQLKCIWSLDSFKIETNDLTVNSYQIKPNLVELRTIPIIIKPRNNINSIREHIMLCANMKGKFTSLRFALEHQYVEKLMENMSQRAHAHHIIEFLENFKTAYVMRDASYLQTIIQSDALILDGFENEGLNTENNITTRYLDYIKITKDQFLRKLQIGLFNQPDFIRVSFENIMIDSSMERDIYGLKILQNLRVNNAHEENEVFVLMDVGTQDPIVELRTLQSSPLCIKDNLRIQ